MKIRLQESGKNALRWVMLCLAFSFATDMNGASLRGDLDNNGDVNVNDIFVMVEHILGNAQGEMPTGADMDEDGTVDINDVLMLVDLILEGERGPIGDGGEANPGYPVLVPQK